MCKYDYLVIDVGSTFTKQRLYKDYRLMASAQSPTTVKQVFSGISVGLNLLQEQLQTDEQIEARHVLSSSSAAGGLRMVAFGYMARVTAKAAKEVAMNSGSKILEILSSEDPSDYKCEVLQEISPDIILLAGGTDGGNEDAILESADIIIKSGIKATVVIAGNINVQRKIEKLLVAAGVHCIRVANIMPTIHELKVSEARDVIHREFIKQITKARGLNELQHFISNDKIMPTPGAVLLATELLAKGTYQRAGLGNIVVIDLGGATTDVHSVIPLFDDIDDEEKGLVITNSKQMSYRTVEGNLGMRVSAKGVINAVSPREILFKHNLNQKELLTKFEDYCEFLEENPEFIAQSEEEKLFDKLLAATAVELALKRHAGRYATEADVRRGFIPGVPMGRDLRSIEWVICVGGYFVNNELDLAKEIVAQALSDNGVYLLPKSPKIMVDKDYLLFSAGTILEVDKAYSMEILFKYYVGRDADY